MVQQDIDCGGYLYLRFFVFLDIYHEGHLAWF